jgi:hypothetical protein
MEQENSEQGMMNSEVTRPHPRRDVPLSWYRRGDRGEVDLTVPKTHTTLLPCFDQIFDTP